VEGKDQKLNFRASPTHLLVIKLSRFPSTRINQLNLTGGEADKQRSSLESRGRLIEVVTARVRSFVQLLVDGFAEVSRLWGENEFD
jgi:hypothetical protein